MSRKLGFSDLNLDYVPLHIFNDPHWQLCLNLALQSKSDSQRYGALLVSPNGEVLGGGRNRRLKENDPHPFRTSFLLHAEKAAMIDALMRHDSENLRGATLFVAGFFVKDRSPLILKKAVTNTCASCTKLYVEFGLLAAFPHAELGWARISGDAAYQNALANQKILKERKMTKYDLRREISI